MHVITANDLKTRGINAFQKELTRQPEVAISVRGKDKFVVMDIHHYHYLRECELEAALLETQSDIKSGKVTIESVGKHIKKIMKGIQKLCSD